MLRFVCEDTDTVALALVQPVPPTGVTVVPFSEMPVKVTA